MKNGSLFVAALCAFAIVTGPRTVSARGSVLGQGQYRIERMDREEDSDVLLIRIGRDVPIRRLVAEGNAGRADARPAVTPDDIVRANAGRMIFVCGSTAHTPRVFSRDPNRWSACPAGAARRIWLVDGLTYRVPRRHVPTDEERIASATARIRALERLLSSPPPSTGPSERRVAPTVTLPAARPAAAAAPKPAWPAVLLAILMTLTFAVFAELLIHYRYAERWRLRARHSHAFLRWVRARLRDHRARRIAEAKQLAEADRAARSGREESERQAHELINMREAAKQESASIRQELAATEQRLSVLRVRQEESDERLKRLKGLKTRYDRLSQELAGEGKKLELMHDLLEENRERPVERIQLQDLVRKCEERRLELQKQIQLVSGEFAAELELATGVPFTPKMLRAETETRMLEATRLLVEATAAKEIYEALNAKRLETIKNLQERVSRIPLLEAKTEEQTREISRLRELTNSLLFEDRQASSREDDRWESERFKETTQPLAMVADGRISMVALPEHARAFGMSVYRFLRALKTGASFALSTSTVIDLYDVHDQMTDCPLCRERCSLRSMYGHYEKDHAEMLSQRQPVLTLRPDPSSEKG